MRLMLLDGPIYGDEAVQYAMSRHWGADPVNVEPVYDLNGPLWWQRVMFPVVLSPGAALGIAAFRVEHALLASLLPVLAAGLLRQAGVRPLLAAGTGVAVAIHPTFVLWGARVFPDTLMACFVLAGLWAHVARRPILAALLLLAAVWTKEMAGLALLGLLVWTAMRGRRAGTVRLWPVELDRPATALAGACLLAPWPLVYAVLGLDGRMPGWSRMPLEWSHVSGVLASEWLIVPIVAGLFWPRSRPWSILSLAYALFYVMYGLTGRGVEAWYFVLPAALALLASAVALDTAARHSKFSVRSAGQVGAAFGLTVILVLAAVPHTVAAKQAATPLAPTFTSLPQLDDLLQGDHLMQTVSSIEGDQWGLVLIIDVGWFNVHYPFAERADMVQWHYTDADRPIEQWAADVEGAGATVVLKFEGPLNRAIRATYTDCVQFENGSYVVIDGSNCPGRAARLQAEFETASA